MREIIFDTETTGLDSSEDRIIEIGGVEMIDRFPTGRSLHFYVNPGDRRVHPEAVAIHGITDERLKDEPRFEGIVDAVIEFFGDARLVAHNAPFDVGFLNAEFARLGRPPLAQDRIIDSLSLARRKHPMAPNSLDALCRRYGIDNSGREKHGALLDSELLAEVYIELIGGKQTSLGLQVATGGATLAAVTHPGPRPKPLPPRLDGAGIAKHRERMRDVLGANGLWVRVRGE